MGLKMEELRSWAVTVCLAALAAGIAGMVTPKGNLEKTYRFTVSLFFLCCVLIPVFQMKNIRLNMDIPALSSSAGDAVQSTVDSQKITQAQDSVSRLVTETFRQNGATPRSVRTTASLSKDGAVSVDRVDVVLSKTNYSRKDSLTKAVQSSLGVPITVTEGET